MANVIIQGGNRKSNLPHSGRLLFINFSAYVAPFPCSNAAREAEFASSCISDMELEYALALLTWRMASQSRQSIEDVLQGITKILRAWPSLKDQNIKKQKVVIDHSYVGFNLSEEGCASFGKERPKDLNGIAFRTDPNLIRVAEQLGERANGRSKFGPRNKLIVVEVPNDIPIRIESYDGNEWVAEEHRVWKAKPIYRAEIAW